MMLVNYLVMFIWLQEIADEKEQAEQNDKIPDQDQITSDPSNPDAESATQEQQSNVDQEQQQA